mgnify:CR=1 FL=1
MRITVVLPYAGLAGGIKVIAIYADRLKRRGHDVFVISTPPKRFPLRRRIKWFLSGRGWVHTPPTTGPSHFDGLNVPHRVLDCWRPVTDDDVPDGDVVVATWWETAEWVARLSTSKGAKAYFVQHDEQVMYSPERQDMRARSSATWQLPMHKIVISQWLRDLAWDRCGDEPVSHVPNSVDMRQFHADSRGKRPVPTIGLLYSTVPFKGVDVSLRALELVRRQIPTLRIVTFGAEGPDKSLPLPANTEFHRQPDQNAIRDLYARCDVWLCGSRSEGFHLPPLEAMACRCPVVSTRVGGPMDIVEDGVNGYLVDVEDARALADRLVHVLGLPEDKWRAMSDAAYATATRYTWDDATGLFEKALETAVERSRRGELGLAHALSASR